MKTGLTAICSILRSKAANVTHNLTITHNGTEVTVYRDGVALITNAPMPALDYTDTVDLTIGARKADSEYVALPAPHRAMGEKPTLLCDSPLCRGHA